MPTGLSILPANVPLSAVETVAVAGSAFDILYPPQEKMPVITVDTFPALGRLAALRFLEWAQQNPQGVVSLPTGKTPEHFIKWTNHFLAQWENPAVKKELEAGGVAIRIRPRMQELRFVQIDEFYPMAPSQHNSFYYYVNKYYIQGFGLDSSKALLMDCSQIGLAPGQSITQVWPDLKVDLTLRTRSPRTRLEHTQQQALARIDQWCQEYEERIRQMGGIGFFLGGIGPDGHVGFNVRGSDHFCTTRLTQTNYETQASAATDLGGMEIARHRLVITIGLGTITYNRHCSAIVMAAGDTKAGVVAGAVENDPGVLYPATALHQLPLARFYATRGACVQLSRRLCAVYATQVPLTPAATERIVIDRALALTKSLKSLTESDFSTDDPGQMVLRDWGSNLPTLLAQVHSELERRLHNGARLRTNTRFLHTEPHHDDIMLGYMPAAVRHVRDASNEHDFATLTSGFTAVTNQFMIERLESLLAYLSTPSFKALGAQGYFDPADTHARNRDIWQYLDGVTARDTYLRDEGAARRLLRTLIEVFDDDNLDNVRDRTDELLHYFRSEYPGKKDLDHIQKIKGMCREWEAECLWGYFGWNSQRVHHLRLGFYTGDIFTPAPSVERDVQPLCALLERVKPDIVTLALDPEGAGPDTHYKVLQALTEALRRYQQSSGRTDITIWGYRNVWYRFHPAEVTLLVPVSLNMFSVMESSFLNTFLSQKEAPFPSYEHEGPFCEIAQKIQSAQYQSIKTCLGREWFHEHASPLLRATRGLVYLKEMTLEQLYNHSLQLREATETV